MTRDRRYRDRAAPGTVTVTAPRPLALSLSARHPMVRPSGAESGRVTSHCRVGVLAWAACVTSTGPGSHGHRTQYYGPVRPPPTCHLNASAGAARCLGYSVGDFITGSDLLSQILPELGERAQAAVTGHRDGESHDVPSQFEVLALSLSVAGTSSAASGRSVTPSRNMILCDDDIHHDIQSASVIPSRRRRTQSMSGPTMMRPLNNSS